MPSNTMQVAANTPATRIGANGFSQLVHQMIAPLRHTSRTRVAEIRRETAREIARLPTSLQRDIGFADDLFPQMDIALSRGSRQ